MTVSAPTKEAPTPIPPLPTLIGYVDSLKYLMRDLTPENIVKAKASLEKIREKTLEIDEILVKKRDEYLRILNEAE